jgi:hypothetical protein
MLPKKKIFEAAYEETLFKHELSQLKFGKHAFQ